VSCHGNRSLLPVQTSTTDARTDPCWIWYLFSTLNTRAAGRETFARASVYDAVKRPNNYLSTALIAEGKDYYVMHIPLTTYYAASPPQPAWIHARYQRLSTLRPRKLPMNDQQIAELFKRVFGFRQALASKVGNGDGEFTSRFFYWLMIVEALACTSANA